MSKQPNYGFPCVDDPNNFIPDAECCSPAELAAHRAACETFGTSDYQPNKGCYTEHDADGQLIKHVLRTSWGVGTNLIDACDGCRMPDFGDGLMTCHECCGQEFCSDCWIEHEKKHDNEG